MTAKEFLEQTSPNDKYGLRAELQKHRLRRMVEKEMEMYHQAKLKLLVMGGVSVSLPSDEEIEKKAEFRQKPRRIDNDPKEEFILGFMQGADWIKELTISNEA